jgi:uncharacterized protein (DUF2384 family)
MTAWDCTEIFRLYDRLTYFLDSGDAREWLVTPNKDLNDRRPCELIESPFGHRRVCELVARLHAADADEE